MNWEDWVMSLKTSLFNWQIIKSNLRRFWWVSVLLLIPLLFLAPNSIYTYETTINNGEAITNLSYISDNGFFAMAVAFFTAGIMFSYLHRVNSVSAFHAIPVKRSQHLISNYISAAVLIGIPIVVATVIMWVKCVDLNGDLNFVFKYFVTSMLKSAMIYTVTAFAAIISGSTVAAYVFSFGFLILPSFTAVMIESLLQTNLYGIPSGYVFEGLLGLFYEFYFYSANFTRAIAYIAIIVVVTILNIVLYNKRRLENYDDIVAFKYLKIAFVWVLALCFGMFGYFMMLGIFGVYNLFIGLLPLGIVAVIGANMINNKSFSIKGSYKYLGAYVLFALVLWSVFRFDITGYERRVPDIDNIESISIDNEYANNIDYDKYYEDGIYYRNVARGPVLKEKDDIENILNLHSTIVNNIPKDKKYTSYRSYEDRFSGHIEFTYKLKDGSYMSREYIVIGNEYESAFNKYYSSDAYKLMYYPILNEYDHELKDVEYYVYDSVGSQEGDTYRVESENYVMNNLDIDSIEAALRADISNGIPKTDIIDDDILYINYIENIEYQGKTLSYDCTETIDNFNRDNFPNLWNLVMENLPNNS